ncbi:hypothetical protein [Sphingopyxis sp. PET50]|uniref:hypothetical protein n=1 Tax=Sphingopyxis sp. PET50 TaxID=2976533 RepID=UPI0021AF9808|nr:hypothetical protein [Sphingopyxis sp. PET50]
MRVPMGERVRVQHVGHRRDRIQPGLRFLARRHVVEPGVIAVDQPRVGRPRGVENPLREAREIGLRQIKLFEHLLVAEPERVEQ